MTKKVFITQLNYIPWKGYFDSIAAVDEFIIYDDMQYTQADWRNRNKIKTRTGLQWLTIPIEVKSKFGQKINEAIVADTRWGKKHWMNLVQNYSKAQYFSEIRDLLEDLYLDTNERYLTKINQRFLERINDYLGISTSIRRSEEFHLAGEKTERLVHLCKQVGATEYYTGPAATAYLDEPLFSQEGIRVHYWDYSGYREYTQLHGTFEHGVTILDLLFNVGKRSPEHMKHVQPVCV